MVLLQKPNKFIHHKITPAIDWSVVMELVIRRGGEDYD